MKTYTAHNQICFASRTPEGPVSQSDVGHWNDQNALETSDGPTIKPTDNGEVCGALGCHKDPEYLVNHPDYGDRVLCEFHAADLLDRPVGKETDSSRSSSSQGTSRSESPRSEASRYVEVGGCGGIPGGWRRRPDGTGGRNSPAVAVAPAQQRDTPGFRRDLARPTPRRTGTCILRRFWGSATLLPGGRATETAKSGVAR